MEEILRHLGCKKQAMDDGITLPITNQLIFPKIYSIINSHMLVSFSKELWCCSTENSCRKDAVSILAAGAERTEEVKGAKGLKWCESVKIKRGSAVTLSLKSWGEKMSLFAFVAKWGGCFIRITWFDEKIIEWDSSSYFLQGTITYPPKKMAFWVDDCPKFSRLVGYVTVVFWRVLSPKTLKCLPSRKLTYPLKNDAWKM